MSHTMLAVHNKSFPIPASFSLLEQEQLKGALDTFYTKHELATDGLSEPVRKVFAKCLQQTVPTTRSSLKALETRIQHTQRELDRVKHTQARPVKESSHVAPVLQKLLKFSQDFQTVSDDHLIEETIQLLSEPMRNRLYYHLYLIHACEGRKTGQDYGKKAFRGIDGHSATNEERSKAILHLYLEQLAARFATLGNQNSPSLMQCFTSLPKELRYEIYFKVYELCATPKTQDVNFGRNIFLRSSQPQETNRIRGEAIYRCLLQQFHTSSLSALPAVAQKQVESLRKAQDALQAQMKEMQEEHAELQVRNQESEHLAKSSAETQELLQTELDALRALHSATTQQLLQLEEDKRSLVSKVQPYAQTALLLEQRTKALELAQAHIEEIGLEHRDLQRRYQLTEISAKDAALVEQRLREELAKLNKLLAEALEHLQMLEHGKKAAEENAPEPEEVMRLTAHVQALEGALKQIATTFGISAEDLLELNELAAEMRSAFQDKIDTLTEAELAALRRNCALMHLKRMELADNKHLRVEFEKDFVPHELPGKPFSAKTVNSSFQRISYQGDSTDLRTVLCPTVAKHVYDKMDRSAIVNMKDLKAATLETFKQANAPESVLAQLELLDSEVVKFQNSSATPEHALHAHFERAMTGLSTPVSKKLAQLAKLKTAEDDAVQAIATELADPKRPNRSEAYAKRKQEESAVHAKTSGKFEKAMQLLTARHQAQLDLEASIQEAHDASEDAAHLERSLKRLALRENTLYQLIDGGGTLARDLLQLEFHLNHLPVGVMRRDEKLRHILSFIEQFRPVIRGLLGELHEQQVFIL